MIRKLHAIWVSVERRNVGSATLASFVSKILSAIVQALSVPVAIAALGTHAFGIFLVLTGVTSWITSTSMGIGSLLTNEIAANHQKSTIPVIGLILGGVQAIIVSLLCYVLFFTSLGSIVGNMDTGQIHDARLAGGLLVVISGLQLAIQPLQGMQMGLLEGRTQFSYQAVANFLVIIALLILRSLPSTTLVVFCAVMAGIPFILSSINVVIFTLKARDLFAWPKLNQILPAVRHLYKQGFAFFFINMASYAMNYGAIVYLAWLTGGSKFIAFSIYNRVVFFLTMFVWLLAMPLWPALVHARANGDGIWIRRVLYGCFHIFLAIAAVVSLVTAGFGHELLNLWAGARIEQQEAMAPIFAIYYVLVIWREFLITILISFDRVRATAKLMLIQVILAYGAGYLLVPRFGELGMAVAMMGSLALTSAWVLPMLIVQSPDGRRHPVIDFFIRKPKGIRPHQVNS